MSEPDERARAARAFIHAHRRRRRPSAYSLYMVIIVGAVLGGLGHGVVSTLLAGGIAVHGLLVFGPAALLLVALGAARFGTWQGPVSFSAADVAWLLTAPIATAALVRPRLDQGLLIGACAGAVAGALLVVLVAGGPAGLGVTRAVCAVAALTALGAAMVAAAWLVQSSRRSARWVRRLSPPAVLLAGAVVILGASADAAGGAWSGPWGWALAPLAGVSGWPLATLLSVAVCVPLVLWARARAGSASVETFLVRAGTRSVLAASAFTLDYRGAALAYRAAQPGAGSARGVHVPRPSAPRAAVAWRDATGLVRRPARVAWAALLGAGATLLALIHPGSVVIAGVVAAAAYVAATLLCEPLRVDVDDPDRSAVLLSWSFARVLLAHCRVPIVLLGAVGAATIVAAVGAGVVGPGALVLIPTALVPLAGTAVLAAALAARRGGRIDQALLTRLLGTDPSNPGSAAVAVVMLAPWLLLTLVAVGAPVAILGHAVTVHRAVVAAGVEATAIALAAAVSLAAVARRSRPEV